MERTTTNVCEYIDSFDNSIYSQRYKQKTEIRPTQQKAARGKRKSNEAKWGICAFDACMMMFCVSGNANAMKAMMRSKAALEKEQMRMVMCYFSGIANAKNAMMRLEAALEESKCKRCMHAS